MKTKVELMKELKELQEMVKLYEMIAEARKKMEGLGYKLDRDKEYIPYPYPVAPCPCPKEPWTITWATGTEGVGEDITTGTPQPKKTTVTM